MYQANADLRNEVSLKQILNPAATTLANVLRLYLWRTSPVQPMLPDTEASARARWKQRW